MNSAESEVAKVKAVINDESAAFTTRVAQASLSTALDVWLKRIARRQVTTTQRARLLRAIERGTAPETMDVQLLHSALLRAAGYDERAAAIAAIEAGATPRDLWTIWGVTPQAVSQRLRSHQRPDTKSATGHKQAAQQRNSSKRAK
ncbi:Fis family transcriptional regulator [Mycobacteroides abscessus]|uniref:Fis family transcriptional regulator n=1 Tax=Mycobacteroides abscessus TaxID=36809 RepID=UPI00189664F2